MQRDKLSWVVGAYRVAILSTLGVIGYLQSGYVTKEKFNDYVVYHEAWNQEAIRSLRADMQEIKYSVRRIEDRLEKKGIGGAITFTNRMSVYGKR